jgi:hypothetical protein
VKKAHKAEHHGKYRANQSWCRPIAAHANHVGNAKPAASALIVVGFLPQVMEIPD